MSGVAGATAAPPVWAPPPASPATTAVPSLLPEGQPVTPGTLTDAMSALYTVLSESRQVDQRSGIQRVQGVEKLRQQAAADAKAAIDHQQQDQKESGFWHDFESVAMIVVKVALAVAAVAVSVVTLGAGSPLLIGVALLFMAGGTIVSETKCFGDKASQWVGLGMELVGAVLSCGAGATVAGETAGSQILTTTANVANATAIGAGVAAGAAHIESGAIEADSQEASADLEQSTQTSARLERLVQWVIDNAKEDDKSHQRAEASLRSAIGTNDETAVHAAASVTVKG